MIFLNSEQQKALESIDTFLRSKQKLYILEGFAGTGKTTVITTLLSSRKFYSKDVVMSATTNKAVSVLQSMFANKYEHIDFKTIHKLCKIKRIIGFNGDISFNLNESPNNSTKRKSIFNYDIIIIDECSMISQKILSLIVSLSNRIKGKIIFLGDRYQLPPVNETISEVFKLPITSSKLNKIIRCSDNVVEFAGRIRNSIDTGKNISTKGCKGDDLICFKKGNIWLDQYIQFFNPNNNDILLAYTNSRCRDINKYIRKNIYGDLSNETYIPNEIIVFNNFYKETPLTLHRQTPESDIFVTAPILDTEALNYANENAAVFYTSHKAIITTCKQIKIQIPEFPLESLFNLNRKLDMNFKNVKPSSFREDKDCPICFEKIKNRDAIETGCSHVFCNKCIKLWLEQNDLCPYCRMTLVDETIVFDDDKHLTQLINQFKTFTTNQIYDVWQIEMKAGKMNGSIYVPISESEKYIEANNKKLKACILEIKKHLESKTGNARKLFIIQRLWEYYYYSYVDIFANISYGYCITVHKSQGSTFDDVYVDCKNILQFNNKETLNCLYTAITRTSKRLSILI